MRLRACALRCPFGSIPAVTCTVCCRSTTTWPLRAEVLLGGGTISQTSLKHLKSVYCGPRTISDKKSEGNDIMQDIMHFGARVPASHALGLPQTLAQGSVVAWRRAYPATLTPPPCYAFRRLPPLFLCPLSLEIQHRSRKFNSNKFGNVFSCTAVTWPRATNMPSDRPRAIFRLTKSEQIDILFG